MSAAEGLAPAEPDAPATSLGAGASPVAEVPVAIEFDLPPDLAPRILRHPALRAQRAGRGRGSAADLIWLDNAEGVLAAAGLALERSGRGAARSVRILPDPARPAWPGGPLSDIPPGTAEALLGAATPVPVVAFSGRRTSVRLLKGEVVLLAGKLRGVAAEAPAARLQLSGPAGTVFALARALCAELPLRPPRASLAEAGRALVRGEAVRPRREGPADLSGCATVGEAMPRLIGHLTEPLLFFAPDARPDAPPVAVHQMRVAARRLRAGLKVFRRAVDGPVPRAIDQEVGELARRLGPARDWDVFLTGLGADLAEAAAGEKRLESLLRAAETARRAAYARLSETLGGPVFGTLLLDLAEASRGGAWIGEAEGSALPLRDYAAETLSRVWKRLREDGEGIEGLDAAGLHELRLTGKRMRYAAELFAPLWTGKGPRRFLRRLSELQESLGVANDTAVARALVAGLARAEPGRAWAVGLAEGWALARGRRARAGALEAWAEITATEPFWKD